MPVLKYSSVSRDILYNIYFIASRNTKTTAVIHMGRMGRGGLYSAINLNSVTDVPHFIIDCSSDILGTCSDEQLIRKIHNVANKSNLFDEKDIKVRVRPFLKFSAGNQNEAFIHVFASIMQGRTTAQKAALSRSIVTKLVSIFPDVPNIAMNVSEFEKSTYCNRHML